MAKKAKTNTPQWFWQYEEKKTEKLVAMAMDFYQGVEAPDANEWDYLFTLLATRDTFALEKLLKEHSIG
jgi:hypothetical protein